MKKAIIFDWSGTLSDNFHCFYRLCRLMFAELGREPISEDEIRKTFTIPYMRFWNKYFPDLSKEKQEKMYETSEFHHSVNGGQGGILSVIKNHQHSREDSKSCQWCLHRWFLTNTFIRLESLKCSKELQKQ